jgi:hypothetical protein
MIESNQLKYRFSKTTIGQILDLSIESFQSLMRFNELNRVEFEFINLLPDPNIEVYTDPLRVQQVIMNLLDNANKFTESGSIKLIARLDSDEILFCIEDTGIGINYNKSDVIFERFIQADSSSARAFGGTGLGLSISSGIVRSLNGKIWLDFSYEGGARFCFTLPLKQPLQKYSSTEKLKIDDRLLTDKKILIVTPSDNQYLFLKKLFGLHETDYKPFLSEGDRLNYDIIISEINEFKKLYSETQPRNNNCGIFVLSENIINSETKSEPGNVKYYQSPVNLKKLVQDINTFLISKATDA